MRWIALLTAVSMMACTRDTATGPTEPADSANLLAGTYGLATINGSPAPQTIGEDGIGTVDVLSGIIRLNPDASYLDILVYRERGPSGLAIVYDTISGSYLHFNQTLLLRPQGGGAGSFFDISDAQTLVAANPGFSLVYRR